MRSEKPRFVIPHWLRGNRLDIGWALLVLFIILALQDSLSLSLSIGRLTPDDPHYLLTDQVENTLWQLIKLAASVPAVVFWVLNRRKLLHGAMIISIALLTFELLASALLLLVTLGEDHHDQARQLIRDTIAVSAINVLVFALWYWAIDSRKLETAHDKNPRFDFLFPQHANSITGWDEWKPNFVDYVFLAFTTSTAFGPTDTLALSRRAKVLMIMQTVVSLIAIVALAGRAFSILD